MLSPPTIRLIDSASKPKNPESTLIQNSLTSKLDLFESPTTFAHNSSSDTFSLLSPDDPLDSPYSNEITRINSNSDPGVAPRKFGSKSLYIYGTPRMLLHPDFLGCVNSPSKKKLRSIPHHTSKKIIKSLLRTDYHSSTSQLILISLVDILTTALGKGSVFSQAMFFHVCDSLLKAGALEKKYFDLPSPMRVNFKTDLYKILLTAATNAHNTSILSQKQLACSSNSISSNSSSNSNSSNSDLSNSQITNSFSSNSNLNSPDSSFDNASALSHNSYSSSSEDSSYDNSRSYYSITHNNNFNPLPSNAHANSSYIPDVSFDESLKPSHSKSVTNPQSSPKYISADQKISSLPGTLPTNSLFTIHKSSKSHTNIPRELSAFESIKLADVSQPCSPSQTSGITLFSQLLKNCQTSRYNEDFYEGRRLGKGGFGEVFEAQNKLDGRSYAVKKIKIKKESTLEKTLREIKVLARLDHPNIVRYYSSWVEMSEYPKKSSNRSPTSPKFPKSNSHNIKSSTAPLRNFSNINIENSPIPQKSSHLHFTNSSSKNNPHLTPSTNEINFSTSVPIFSNKFVLPSGNNLDLSVFSEKSVQSSENFFIVSNSNSVSAENSRSSRISSFDNSDSISSVNSSGIIHTKTFVPPLTDANAEDDDDDWSDGVVFENQDFDDFYPNMHPSKPKFSSPNYNGKSKQSFDIEFSKNSISNNLITSKNSDSFSTILPSSNFAYPPIEPSSIPIIYTDEPKSSNQKTKHFDNLKRSNIVQDESISRDKKIYSHSRFKVGNSSTPNKKKSNFNNFILSKTAPENESHLNSIFFNKSSLHNHNAGLNNTEKKTQATLFVQMQLCQSNLREYLLERNSRISKNQALYGCLVDKNVNLAVFRAVTSAVKVIHNHGLIHRDLKPANVFLDLDFEMCAYCKGTVENPLSTGSIPSFTSPKSIHWDHVFKNKFTCNKNLDSCKCTRVKLVPRVGDFGLVVSANFDYPNSKISSYSDFLKNDAISSNVILNPSLPTHPLIKKTCPDIAYSSGKNASHTSGVGTVTYSAPEQISCSNQSYNSKADIYSLGIIFFELFYPFNTLMERDHVLRELRSGIFPPSFVQRYPKYTEFIKSLMSINPDLRPTSSEILESNLLNLSQLSDLKPAQSSYSDPISIKNSKLPTSGLNIDSFQTIEGHKAPHFHNSKLAEERHSLLSFSFENNHLKPKPRLAVARTDTFDIICGTNSFASSSGIASLVSGSSISNTSFNYKASKSSFCKSFEASHLSKSGSLTRNSANDMKLPMAGIREENFSTPKKDSIPTNNSVGMLSLLLNPSGEKLCRSFSGSSPEIINCASNNANNNKASFSSNGTIDLDSQGLSHKKYSSETALNQQTHVNFSTKEHIEKSDNCHSFSDLESEYRNKIALLEMQLSKKDTIISDLNEKVKTLSSQLRDYTGF
ncbi:Eukaryotic translation initiation factor 2-alpha kinase 1 [Smittium culicis]|uniref:Eukaryotic translation initiation factor 2-alpha kinase 1 n=1 Tax=Smittium culicis TaxID=133412 RepID=A0A1R1XY53_9FUNG|nr:Eukaryotic translation initiation factor 2-alpha kinase 1 [Smittium culicis]